MSLDKSTVLGGCKIVGSSLLAVCIVLVAIVLKPKNHDKVESRALSTQEIRDRIDKRIDDMYPNMPKHVRYVFFKDRVIDNKWSMWYDKESGIFHEICPNGEYLQYRKDNQKFCEV